MALTDFQPLLAAASRLLEDAKGDPDLAQRLLDDPKGEIAKAAGQPVPEGIQLDLARGDDGSLTLSAAIDPEFEGEIDDEVLEAVSGGARTLTNLTTTTLLQPTGPSGGSGPAGLQTIFGNMGRLGKD